MVFVNKGYTAKDDFNKAQREVNTSEPEVVE